MGTEIIAAIVGSVVTLLGGAISWLVMFLQRPRRAQDVFEFRFDSSQGQNIFHRNVKASNPSGFDKYFVRVHFILAPKIRFTITNIDLTYDAPNLYAGTKSVRINNPVEISGSSDRLSEFHVVEPGVAQDIEVSRQFVCEFSAADNCDYRTFVATVEFSTAKLNGFQKILIYGKLEPGGSVSDVSAQLLVDAA